MTDSQTSLRKAAIFLASLDEATAEALLAQLPPEQARALRVECDALDGVDERQQQSVIDDFLADEPRAWKPLEFGLELDERLGGFLQLETPGRDDVADPPADESSNEPFQFLHEIDNEHLVGQLSGEHPQAIALVLVHMPIERAAVVLAAMPPEIQQDVVARLVERDETHPEILREVERELETRIQEHSRRAQLRRHGVHWASSLLSEMGGTASQRLLSGLAQRNPELAGHLGFQRRTALCLDDLDSRALQAGFDLLGEEVFALALAGALADEAERTLRKLPEWEASRVRAILAELRPTRISDLDAAYQQLLACDAVVPPPPSAV